MRLLKIRFACYLFLMGLLIGARFVPREHIDNEFKSYYNDFIAKLDKKCYNDEYEHPIKTTIIFGDTTIAKDAAVGYCYKTQLGVKIVINKAFWYSSNEDIKYALINHELTHCFLNKDHVKDPTNYMYPVLQPWFSIGRVNSQLDDIIRMKCTKWED